MDTAYNKIGVNYAELRKPDPRLIELISAQLIDLNTILNVGAGAGSYEPDDKNLIALEPSWRMISQRPVRAAPSVCGVAESLPFPDNSFDGGLALLTLHHWRDIDRGLNELKRVVTERLVIHTWDPTATENFWLINDYVPELLALDAKRFPKIEDLITKFQSARIIEVPIPCDCTDGFEGAYWRRPEAYLDDHVKKGISSFQQISQKALAMGLARLRADLDRGIWHKRYTGLLDKEAIDLGYRLIVAKV